MESGISRASSSWRHPIIRQK